MLQLSNDHLVTIITEQIADYYEIDASNIEPPLYEAVDLEALCKVLQKGGPTTPINVSFTHDGTLIEVSFASEVTVNIQEYEADRPRPEVSSKKWNQAGA